MNPESDLSEESSTTSEDSSPSSQPRRHRTRGSSLSISSSDFNCQFFKKKLERFEKKHLKNIWRNLVTLKKTYLAAVTNMKVKDPTEAPSRAKALGINILLR